MLCNMGQHIVVGILRRPLQTTVQRSAASSLAAQVYERNIAE
jgi:hypothetical protein